MSKYDMTEELESAYMIEIKVFELEEIRIVIRTARLTKFKPYRYEKKAARNTTLASFLVTRIYPLLLEIDPNIEIDVIDGNGVHPHPRTPMDTVRNSYIKA